MPLVSKTFSEIITFTRASTGTYFNAAGTLTSAAIDEPRLDYNPSTLAAQGLLIEESRSNLATYSAQFDNAAWVKTNLTVTANAIASPDGASNADFYDDGTASAPHYLALSCGIAVSTTYAVSVFAKKNNLNFISVGITDTAVGDRFAVAAFNINTGAVSASLASGTGYAVVSTSISSVGNGWYRCAIVATVGSTAVAPRFVIASSTDGTVPAAGGGFKSYTGANNQTYIWGAQIEVGAFATSYIPTTTTALTRAADVASVNTLSPWYNAAEGTLYTESLLTRQNATAGLTIAQLSNSGTSYINTFYRASGVTGASVVDAGVSQADLSPTGVLSANTVAKLALAYKANDFAASGNGGTASTDTSGTVPTGINVFSLGLGTGTGFSGYLRRITYYPRRLSDAELQTLTT